MSLNCLLKIYICENFRFLFLILLFIVFDNEPQTVAVANNYNEAFKEFVSFNKDYNGLPHNIIPYINHRTFKSNYRIFVFETRYQSDHIGPQPRQLNFKFSAAVADVICHALVLTRKVISVNSDGNKMVDIVS